MEKRPLFTFGAAIFAGALSACLKPWYLTYAALAAAPIICMLYCILHLRRLRLKRDNLRYIIELIVISVIAAALPIAAYIDCANVWRGRIQKYSEYDGREVEAVVKFTSSIEKAGSGLRIEAAPLSMNGVAAEGYKLRPADRVYFYFGGDIGDATLDAFKYGATARVRGRLTKPAPQQNEYLFSYQTHLYSKGIVANIYDGSGGVEILTAPFCIAGIPMHPIGAGIAIKERIANVFLKVLPPKEAALLTAIFLGSTENLDEQSYDDFTASGLLHLTAVSGLHIIIVAGLVSAAVKRAGFGVRSGRALSLFVVVLFAFIAGFSASVVRAALAYGLCAISQYAGRAFDRLSALGAAAIVIMLYNPMQVSGAGFLLSFSSALSICILSQNFHFFPKSLKAPRAIVEPINISVAICIGCYPIQATLFHRYSSISVIANMLCAPLVTCVLGTGIVMALIGLFSASLATFPAFFAINFLWAIENIASFAARAPYALLRPGALSPQGFIFYYSVVALLLYLMQRHARAAAEAEAADAAVAAAEKAVAADAAAVAEKAVAGAEAAEVAGAVMVEAAATNAADAMATTAAGAVAAAAAGVGMIDSTLHRKPRFFMSPVIVSGMAVVEIICISFAIMACVAFVFFAASMLNPKVLPDEMEIVFLDVGNSNATYINIEGKYHVIIDAGGASGYIGINIANASFADGGADESLLYSESRLSEYLSGRGIGEIDLAIATHGDIDHIQGFWNVLDNVRVRRLLLPNFADKQLDFLATHAKTRGTQVTICTAGDTIRLGSNTAIEILSPFPENDYRQEFSQISTNDAGIVARVVYGEMKALFCGDIGTITEGMLIRNTATRELASNLISVPHHGSKYSSGEEFLAWVSPEVAVAGVGKNRYGHPAPETMERYAAENALFLRTDMDGMVVVRCDVAGIKSIWRFNDPANLPAWRR